MKMYLLFAASLLLLSGCQGGQRPAAPVIDGPPVGIIPDHPVWVNASCPTRTIRLLTDNVLPEQIAIRLDKTTVNAKPVAAAQSGSQTYWDINIPTDEGYQLLSIVRTNGEEGEEELASAPIFYTQPGEEVRIFSQYTQLPPPGSKEPSICWPDYSGTIIPGGKTYTLRYEMEQVDRLYASAVRRTIKLSNVTLEENSSGTAYRIEPTLDYTVTIPEAVALIDRVDGLGGIDLGDTGRKVQQSTVKGVTLNSSSNVFPAYQVVKYEYGKDITIRINDCTSIDTLSSSPFTMVDHLEIILDCQPSR